MPIFPWLRYDGDYTSGWDNPKKKPAEKKVVKKTSAKKTRKPKRKD